jgi:hypothetical protein
VGPQIGGELDGHGPLWVVGDGISTPLFDSPETLSPEQAWPDIEAPTRVEAGTRLQARTIDHGVLGDIIANLVVSALPDVPPRLAPDFSPHAYHYLHATQGTCSNYCQGSYCTNSCSVCSACWAHGWTCDGVYSHAPLGHSSSFVCSDAQKCTASCSGGASHYCWYSDVVMRCIEWL